MNRFPGKSAWLLLSLGVIVADQYSKWLVAVHFRVFETLVILPVFNVALLHNTGAAFSVLAGASGWQRWLFVVLALVISGWIAVYLWRSPRQGDRWMAAALALIAGGALGNVIDRLVHGYVIDFVQLHWEGWYYPAFNLADSAITVGALILLTDGLLRRPAAKPGQE